MKKVLAIACLVVVFTIAMAAMASATESNWRFYLKADDGANSNSAAAMTIGVYTATYASKDGNYADSLGSDGQDVRMPIGTTPATAKAVEGLFGNMLWNKDVKSPRPPSTPIYAGEKTWQLRVAGLSGASALTPIRLQFLTISSSVLPTATVGGLAAEYYLRMVDNKGMEGAPANGTIWEIPIPTVHSVIPYFTLTLPALILSSSTEPTFISEGYQMEFYQTTAPVPEPSSLLALGAGLMGLAGFASRRRRS